MNKQNLIRNYVKYTLLESLRHKSSYSFSVTEELDFRHLYNFIKKSIDDNYKKTRKSFSPFDNDKLIKKHGKKYIEERLTNSLDKMMSYEETRNFIKKLSPVHGSSKRKLVYLYHDVNDRDIVMIDDGNLKKLSKKNILDTYEKILKALIPHTDSFNKELLEDLLENAKSSADPMKR